MDPSPLPPIKTSWQRPCMEGRATDPAGMNIGMDGVSLAKLVGQKCIG